MVGAPRSGFSLLISIINSLLATTAQQPRPVLDKKKVQLAGLYFTERVKQTFAQLGITHDLIYNGEFRLLTGGPKWLSQDNPQRAYFRKYFGVRQMGDFLLVTSHPHQVLQNDAVVHSHVGPVNWSQNDYYKDFTKFTSIRNPLGIVNSAAFSLNAMASEYIQKFMPNAKEETLRKEIGLSKLTDMKVVGGLITYLRDYLLEYLKVSSEFAVMRWEHLIERPQETICTIASRMGIECDLQKAQSIWSPIDHVNTLQYHKHNFRKGKGLVGDWKSSLTNEHLDLFREMGFDSINRELGYPTISHFDRSDYSPFQRLAEQHLRRGEAYDLVGDRNLATFAFNKSNIATAGFNFKSYPPKERTWVERSSFTDDRIVEAISEVAEEACADIDAMLDADIAGNAQLARHHALGLVAKLQDPSAGEVLVCDH